MPNQYGPWATTIDAGGNPELSTFWRRRLTMLAPTSSTSPVLSRRSVLCLGAAGAATMLLPTLRAAVADDKEPSPGSQNPRSARIYFQGAVKLKNGDGKASGIFAVDPETGRCEMVISNGGGFRVSRDGATIAFDKPTERAEIWTYDLATRATARALDDGRDLFPATDGEQAAKGKFYSGRPVWSPDGKQIVGVACRWEDDPKGRRQHITRLVNRDGSGVKRLPLPQTDEVLDWSPDGQWFVTSSSRDKGPDLGYQLYRMRPDGTEQLRLTKGGQSCYARFSPDGRQIVYYHRDFSGPNRDVVELHVMDADGANDHIVLRSEGMNTFNQACWSPDGRRLAVVWFTWALKKDGTKVCGIGEEHKHRIEIMDADGKNRREIKLGDAVARYVCEPDWR
jgi:Tol biopolymer transport system component